MKFLSTLKSILHYGLHSVEGKDGQLSIKRLLALAFSADLIRNIHHIIFKWESGHALSDVIAVLQLEGFLLLALLGIVSYDNLQQAKLDSKKETKAGE